MNRLACFLLSAVVLGFAPGCATSSYSSAFSASLRFPKSQGGTGTTTVQVLETDGRARSHEGSLSSMDLVPGHHTVVLRLAHYDSVESFAVRATMKLYVEAGHSYEMLTQKEGDVIALIVRDRTPGVDQQDRDQRFAATVESQGKVGLPAPTRCPTGRTANNSPW